MSKPNSKASQPAPVATNNIATPADALTNPPSPPDENPAVLSTDNQPHVNDQPPPPSKGEDLLPSFEVVSTLDHDGQRYDVGSIVNMSHEQAALIPNAVKAL